MVIVNEIVKDQNVCSHSRRKLEALFKAKQYTSPQEICGSSDGYLATTRNAVHLPALVIGKFEVTISYFIFVTVDG